MNYQEAIRIAEEREKKLREVFDRSDHDHCGSIDIEETLPLLDDLGLIKRLKTDRIEFATKAFLLFDIEGNGELSFEEFKGFYNCAIDDCAGKKPKPPKVKRWNSSVEPEVEAARLKVAEERARKQAEESERICRENADIKTKVAASNKGKDAKAVEAEVQAARRAAMGERARGRAEDKARIAVENKAMKERIKTARAQEGEAAREAVTNPDAAAEQPAGVVDSKDNAAPEVQAGEAASLDHDHNDDQVEVDG